MSNYIESLHWRYATKKFDSTKKLSDEQLNTLLESVRLSASSYGLQPYHIFIVTDKEIRAKLQPASWGQSQIVDASHLIVFAAKTEVDGNWIDTYLENVSTTREIPMESLSGYGDFMKSKILELSSEEQATWAGKQTYLALGNLLSAAAELRIDSCPMEGFEPEVYNDILGLTEKGLHATVIAAVGYRSGDDETQHYKKVRQSKENLETYV